MGNVLGGGKSRAYCGACDETFSTVSNFDRHLDGYGPVTCRHPVDVGLELKSNGTWGLPAPGPRDINDTPVWSTTLHGGLTVTR